MPNTTNAIFAVLSVVIFTTIPLNPASAQPIMTRNSINGMNVGTMNFANLFNGSSFFGALGTSMVNGVKVAGISILTNNNVYVTLKYIITNPANTALPGGVTVTAIRVPMNLKNLISAASAASNTPAASAASNTPAASAASNTPAASAASSGTINRNLPTSPTQGFGTTVGRNSASIMSNPFAFSKSIQIGSSNIANPNWRMPQPVTMGLVGMNGSNSGLVGMNGSNSLQTADFIIVSVVPFTGKSTQNGAAFK